MIFKKIQHGPLLGFLPGAVLSVLAFLSFQYPVLAFAAGLSRMHPYLPSANRVSFLTPYF